MSSSLERIYEKSPITIQTILLTIEGLRLKRLRFNKHYENMMKSLERFEYIGEEEIELLQFQKLQRIIRHVYSTVPYYRNLMENMKLTPKDFNALKDLQKLPILTKNIVTQHFNDLISRAYKRRQLYEGHTSGTTGSPFHVLYDKNTVIAHNAAIWWFRKMQGFEFGRPYATILGRVIVPLNQTRPPFWRFNRFWNQLFLSSFHLKDENLKYYFEAMRRYKIEAIQAYPSTAYILAKYLDKRDDYFAINFVFTSSETLLPIQRETIAKRFKCKVYDSYGLAEKTAYLSECNKFEGYHLHPDYGIVEILDDKNEPVPKGHFGKIVATGLNNYAMPLIRYEVGDISRYKLSQCSCGRNLHLLDGVTTKAEDIVVTPEGRLISSSVLTHPFKPLHNITKSQIIQTDMHSLLIKIVRGNGYNPNDGKLLLKEMRKRVGKNISITINYVNDIPNEKSGKYRWVVSTVPLNFGSDKYPNLYSTIE